MAGCYVRLPPRNNNALVLDHRGDGFNQGRPVLDLFRVRDDRIPFRNCFLGVGKIKQRKVFMRDDVERCEPFGQYSMSPDLRADKLAA